jgi:hypothetical protein
MVGLRVFKDIFHNTAYIKEICIYPYYGAKELEKGYRLILKSDYDSTDSIYYLSIFQSMAAALNKLKEFSCGTFKEIYDS